MPLHAFRADLQSQNLMFISFQVIFGISTYQITASPPASLRVLAFHQLIKDGSILASFDHLMEITDCPLVLSLRL